MLVGKSDTPTVRIYPAVSTQVVMAVLVSIGPILLVLSLIYNVEIVISGLVCLACVLVWMSVSTIRIKIYSDRIERWVFWRKSWSVDIGDAEVKDGSGGDFPVIPALIVTRKSTGKKVGEILKPQFAPADIAAIRSKASGA